MRTTPVSMFCAGLGNARGALILATARQGSRFFPTAYPPDDACNRM